MRRDRDDIGQEYCRGQGVEIGAGTCPTAVHPEASVRYVDVRDAAALEAYFQSPGVVQVESIDAVRGQSFDFLIAHHVLEHIPSTLETLVQWMELVVDEGRMFLSVPNHTTTADSRRLVTPPTHFLLDYIYQIGPDDFESREHIGSFLWSWIDVGGLEGRSKVEAADLVSSAMTAPTNDLHWHVFNAHTLDLLKMVRWMEANTASWSGSGRPPPAATQHEAI